MKKKEEEEKLNSFPLEKYEETCTSALVNPSITLLNELLYVNNK